MIDYTTFRATFVQVTGMLTRAKDKALENLYAPIYYDHREAQAWAAGYRFAVELQHQCVVEQLRLEAQRQTDQEEA